MYQDETVTLTYQYINTGDIMLSVVAASDDDGPVCEDLSLAAGATQDSSRSLVIDQTKIITGQDPPDNDVGGKNSASVNVISGDTSVTSLAHTVNADHFLTVFERISRDLLTFA